MRSINNCCVCVVGGAGFLGSHLTDYLIKDRCCNVIVIDNLCVGRRAFVHPAAEFIHHDITLSEEFLYKLFKKRNVKYVFNYAAWPYIPDSFSRPKLVFGVNASGAINVINAAADAECEGVLQVSSAEIYGDAAEGKINEAFPVRPHSTYGAAKAAIDYYCQCAFFERGTRVISLRQFNCVGPRETHPYVVPEIISQIYGMVQLGILDVAIDLGNNSFRDFQYAGDAVRMATELLEKGQFGEVYNMGAETGVRIYDLAHMIGKLMKCRSLSINADPQRMRPWEIWHLQSDNSKLYSVIDSRPEVSLERALQLTIDYFHDEGGNWNW